MANLVDHAGHCCGVRNIYGMDNTTIAELDRQLALVCVEGNDNRLTEIILSERQVTPDRISVGNRWTACVTAAGGWPAVLAARGFRLVSRFRNSNSGQLCYIFHHVTRFESFDNLPFAWDFGDFRAADNGGAGGDPRVAPRPPQVPFEAIANRARREGEFLVGDRVRYIRGGTRAHGSTGTVIRTSEYRNDTRYGSRHAIVYVRGDNRSDWQPASRNLELIVAEAPAPAAPTVVATFFANHYRDTGRGALYETLARAQQAAPRCRQQDRLEILSDGTQRWTEGVQ